MFGLKTQNFYLDITTDGPCMVQSDYHFDFISRINVYLMDGLKFRQRDFSGLCDVAAGIINMPWGVAVIRVSALGNFACQSGSV